MEIRIKQYDITDCGAVCLASAAAYYKLNYTIAGIRKVAGTDQKGTTATGMIKAAESLGFRAIAGEGTTEALLQIPLPAIAHVIEQDVQQHYVVIYAIEANRVEYMDPADGKMHKESFEKFAKKWTNILILLIPGEQHQFRTSGV